MTTVEETPFLPADSLPRNQALADAVVAAGPEPASRLPLYRALLDGVVIIPTLNAPGDPGIRVLLTHSTDGASLLLGFSSVEALRAWSTEMPTCAVSTGPDLARMARENRVGGAVIDAAGPNPVALSQGELDMLADSMIPDPSGGLRGFGRRRVRPATEDLPPAAVTALEGFPRSLVAAFYHFSVSYDGGAPAEAVGVLLVPGVNAGDARPEVEALVGRLAKALDRGRRVDLIVVDDILAQALTPAMRIAAAGSEPEPERLFLAMPADWVAMRLPSAGVDADRLTEQVLSGRPELAPRRDLVASTMTALAEAVSATRPLYAGGTFLDTPGGLRPVTLLVNAVPAEAARDPRTGIAGAGGGGRPERRDCSQEEVELPAGRASRLSWLQTTQLAGSEKAGDVLVVQYFVSLAAPRPGLVLTFSSPAVDLKAVLLTLFDAIARSVEFR